MRIIGLFLIFTLGCANLVSIIPDHFYLDEGLTTHILDSTTKITTRKREGWSL
jgi:hypothetical protein